jgi:hypothetical protein
MSFWAKVRGVLGSNEARPASSPQDLLADQVAGVIRELFPDAAIQRGVEGFQLLVRRGGGGEQTLFLDNVFKETRDLDPAQRIQHIQRFVRAMAALDATPMTWDEVAPNLAPLLRTPSMFGGSPQTAEMRPLYRAAGPFLIECVGIDSENGIAYVGTDLPAKWGVTAEDVFTRSTENAHTFFQDDVAPYDTQAPYPIWHVSRDDSYESSRLLVPGWLASFGGKVKGRPVAIVPERSTLIVGGDGDARCLKRLVESAKAEFGASPRCISPALYTVDTDGKVVPLVLPPQHALATDVAVGHAMMASIEYETQQKAHQQRVGDGVFVASFKAIKTDAGAVLSYTTWTQGVASSLPRADDVALVTPDGDRPAKVIRVPWKVLLMVAGGHLEPEEGVDPPRWRTKGSLDKRMLEALRAAGSP